MIPADPDGWPQEAKPRNRRRLRSLLLGVSTLLVYYLIWGILDELGGVKGLLNWTTAMFGQAPDWFNGTASFYTPEGYLYLPNSFLLVTVLLFAVPSLALLLYAFFETLTDDSSEYYRRLYEEQKIRFGKYVEQKQEEKLNEINAKLDELLKKKDDSKEKGS